MSSAAAKHVLERVADAKRQAAQLRLVPSLQGCQQFASHHRLISDPPGPVTLLAS